MAHIHFIGIGGVGMNGLAQLAVHNHFTVSGSDRAYDPASTLFRQLEQLGIKILPQDGSGIDTQCEQVVYSTAIEPDNPDLVAAKEHSIPLLHRADFLNQLIGSGSELIAIAGTAGKTTTTGMLGWIFESLGLDPSVYNGAAVLNWRNSRSPGNVRAGSSRLWIIEADESDKSFLTFSPTHSIITNISKDHYELDELHSMFSQFREQTVGTIIEGDACPPNSNHPNSFIYEDVLFSVPVLGQHNLENALCAVRLCSSLGLNLEQVARALSDFKGIERRLEVAGNVDGITVIDDYAHNAAKISAALEAVSSVGKQVYAYWRPHGFTPLFQGMDDLVDALKQHFKNNKGSVFILPVFYAGGTVERKATSNELVHRLNSAGTPAVYVPDYNTLKTELEKRVKNGDAIIGMGARDPELPVFAKRLVTEWKKP